ncbi:MAG: acyl-CoA/acyl-ACP dehydrogenase [Rhizorhabdus sp.]|jgi:alkylation response protein AidB-like acyl-CoA dehydrogenase|uniref:acyl-CoA dehydrogenase family protein n=1 Tax=Rhizorhabdus sp. TaxID=1968843 RepID=UPI001B58A05B|nr:acyl-CoA dehydrogenase family protein [Rhizorhabdus sp.]MBP8233406.1 acyl-CoA/acyl-ACP dehydrogenase [Rhizorhabdus sp.]
MQFALTQEQEMIVETTRGIMADFRQGLRATIDSPDDFDRAHWRTITAELGLGALALPAEQGGAGLGLVELSLVAMEMGRALFPSPFLTSIGAALPLLRHCGSEEQIARHAPDLASGSSIAAVASGARLRIEDGRLSGEALVAFGGVADLLIVLADGRALLVPAKDLRIDRLASMDLSRPLARVHFDRTTADLLPRSQGIERALDEARVALAAECVGGADAALTMTVDYSQQRIQFGRPIGSFQALKHRMADMMIAVEAARSAVYYAAAARDEDSDEAASAAAIAHFTAIETFEDIAAGMIQIHGGMGFTWEHDAHLFFKRARGSATLFGTPAESRARLATMLGLDEEDQ